MFLLRSKGLGTILFREKQTLHFTPYHVYYSSYIILYTEKKKPFV